MPLLVFLLIGLSGYSFYILSMAQRESRYSDRSLAREIVNDALYWTILALALWSLIAMVYSTPGYMPWHFRYDPDLMKPRDMEMYNQMMRAMHSTLV